MDLAPGELVEQSLDAFIAFRAKQNGEGEREREEMYMESVRRYHGRRRDERLWERLRYHEEMLENHTRTFTEILERHRAGVSRCEQQLGIQSEKKGTVAGMSE